MLNVKRWWKAYALFILSAVWLILGIGIFFPYVISLKDTLSVVMGFCGLFAIWLPILAVLIVSTFDRLYDQVTYDGE